MVIRVAAVGPGLRQTTSLLFCHLECQIALVTFSTSLHLAPSVSNHQETALMTYLVMAQGGLALALQTQQALVTIHSGVIHNGKSHPFSQRDCRSSIRQVHLSPFGP